MDSRLTTVLQVVRTFVAGTVITLAIAGSVTFQVDEGSAAALVTLCSVVMLFVGLLIKTQKRLPLHRDDHEPCFGNPGSVVLAIGRTTL